MEKAQETTNLENALQQLNMGGKIGKGSGAVSVLLGLAG